MATSRIKKQVLNIISDNNRTAFDLTMLNKVRNGMANMDFALCFISGFGGIAFKANNDYMQILTWSYANYGDITVYSYVAGDWYKKSANMGSAERITA